MKNARNFLSLLGAFLIVLGIANSAMAATSQTQVESSNATPTLDSIADDSSNGSGTTSPSAPTNVGSDTTWTATISDTNYDDVYLVVCLDTDTLTAAQTATGTITFTTGVPADGDYITVDSIIYEFDTAGDDVTVGRTSVDTSSASTVTDVATALVAVENGTSSFMESSAGVVTVVASASGISGNSIGMTEGQDTNGYIALSGATLSGGAAPACSTTTYAISAAPVDTSAGSGTVTATTATRTALSGDSEANAWKAYACDTSPGSGGTYNGACTSGAQGEDTATVEAAVGDTLTAIAVPTGTFTGINVTISQNSGDTLDVSATTQTDLNIKLANTTASKNTASLIQTAVRALETVGTTDYSNWVFTAGGNWDTATTGATLTTNTDAMAAATDTVSPFYVNHAPVYTTDIDTDVIVESADTANPGDVLTFTIAINGITDSDTNGGQDTVSMYVCSGEATQGGATDTFTVANIGTNPCAGGGGTDGTLLCSDTNVDNTATALTCDDTNNYLNIPVAHGNYNVQIYIIDNHELISTTLTSQANTAETYAVNDVAPVIDSVKAYGTDSSYTTPMSSAFTLTSGGTKTFYWGAAIHDDNGDGDISTSYYGRIFDTGSATTTLTASVTSGSTANISVASTSGFAASGTFIIGSDTITYGNIVDGTTFGGISGVSANHSSGDTVSSLETNDCDTSTTTNANAEHECYGASQADTCTIAPTSLSGVTTAGIHLTGDDKLAELQCSKAIYFNANASTNWRVHANIADGTTTNVEKDSDVFEIGSLTAIDVQTSGGAGGASITYAALSPGSDSGTADKTVYVANVGNTTFDTLLSGTDMCDNWATPYSSCTGNSIGIAYQKYSESTGTAYASRTAMSSTAPTTGTDSGCINDTLAKRTQNGDFSGNDPIYFGIGIPAGKASGTYTGQNTFSASAATTTCD